MVSGVGEREVTDRSTGAGEVNAVPDFESFYLSEYRSVVTLGLALTGRVGLAEEIAQEAFLSAHRKWEQVRHYDQPGAFVRRVVANLAVSAFRRRVHEAAAMER